MGVSPSFRTFVLEQLSRLDSLVRARSMFGGVGIYSGELFFALIDEDTLYFKVDDSNRPDFVARGMQPSSVRPRGRDDAILRDASGSPGGRRGLAVLGGEGGRRRASQANRAFTPRHPGTAEGRKEPMIRKLASGEYRLYSRKKDPKTGKRRNLGTFKTRAAAEKHERAVQYFKRQG